MSSQLWEDFISLKSQEEPAFEVLGPAKDHWEQDKRRADFKDLAYQDALEADLDPLPETKDREGYYGPHHFSYWASGFEDASNLIAAAKTYNIEPKQYLDLGCASGRVMRHMRFLAPEMKTMGCDINRHHIEWCNLYLPEVSAFHNHSIPSLPLPDASVDLVSSFSVFTHIEAFETAWLMELRRILRPGGLAWVTIHTEDTLKEMNENWPLWAPVMNHPQIGDLLDEDRNFKGNRLVVRWRGERSYSSNIFYKKDYVSRVWSKFFEVAEIRRRFPRFQDVLVLIAR